MATAKSMLQKSSVLQKEPVLPNVFGLSWRLFVLKAMCSRNPNRGRFRPDMSIIPLAEFYAMRFGPQKDDEAIMLLFLVLPFVWGRARDISLWREMRSRINTAFLMLRVKTAMAANVSGR